MLGALLAALAIGGFFGASSLDKAGATHGSSSIHRCNQGLMDIRPCGAKGWYVKNGDVIVINDVREDGLGAIIFWHVEGAGISGRLRDRSGADGRPAYDNRNLPEGRVIRFSVCLTNGGNLIGGTCSKKYSSGT